MTVKQDYAAALNAVIARYGAMEDGTIRRVLALLERTRQDIAVLLLDAQNYEGYRLQQLDASIERIIAQFGAQTDELLRQSATAAFDSGGQAMVAPLQALGIPQAFLTPAPQLLNTLLDYNAALVTGITDDLRAAVNIQVRNVALGLQNPTTAMLQLTQQWGQVGVQQGKMVTSGISAKAERVMRTELQTTFNVANYTQQQANAGRIPGLTKRWIATADRRTRKGHLRIHRETAAKPIPVDEPYIVYDINDDNVVVGRAELRFPGDPLAPGWAVINCRCTQATIHPEIGVIGSSLDGRIAAEMKRREEL
jgi:hypothetical protein